MVSSIVPITEKEFLVITFPQEIELPWTQVLKAAYSTSTSLIKSIDTDISIEDHTVTIYFELDSDID